MFFVPTPDTIDIREVWQTNLEEEFSLIRHIVDDYPYVGMDTEFPGEVVKTLDKNNRFESNFRNTITNVNLMKLIQLGLTFTNANGVPPTCGTEKHIVWQFNFREFDPDEDIRSEDSIKLLKDSGIDFERNKQLGVDIRSFGALLCSSGVVMNDNVRWIVFQGGYDFAYLIKLLSGRELPDTVADFSPLLRRYFPVLYDMKYLLRDKPHLHGALDVVAAKLDAQRVGTSHQAGSDSLLTITAYWQLELKCYGGRSPVEDSGKVYNLLLHD